MQPGGGVQHGPTTTICSQWMARSTFIGVFFTPHTILLVQYSDVKLRSSYHTSHRLVQPDNQRHKFQSVVHESSSKATQKQQLNKSFGISDQAVFLFVF